ncbi:hypothetical protein Tco_0129988 [Tanacetum coccineum]
MYPRFLQLFLNNQIITHVVGEAEQVVIAAAKVVNASVSVSTTEPKTPLTTTTTLLEDDEVTVAATLVQNSETSKAKSIVFEDVEESAKEQREGKAPMVEEDVWISQKSQENNQKLASTDSRIRRVQKEAKDSKPKPEKSSLSQIQSKMVNKSQPNPKP